MYFGHISFSFFAFSVFFLFYSVFRFQHGSVWSKIFRVTFYGLRTVASTTKKKNVRNVHTCIYSIIVDIRCIYLYFCTFEWTIEEKPHEDEPHCIHMTNIIWLSIYTVWGCSNIAKHHFIKTVSMMWLWELSTDLNLIWIYLLLMISYSSYIFIEFTIHKACSSSYVVLR